MCVRRSVLAPSPGRWAAPARRPRRAAERPAAPSTTQRHPAAPSSDGAQQSAQHPRTHRGLQDRVVWLERVGALLPQQPLGLAGHRGDVAAHTIARLGDQHPPRLAAVPRHQRLRRWRASGEQAAAAVGGRRRARQAEQAGWKLPVRTCLLRAAHAGPIGGGKQWRGPIEGSFSGSCGAPERW